MDGRKFFWLKRRRRREWWWRAIFGVCDRVKKNSSFLDIRLSQETSFSSEQQQRARTN